MKNSNNTLIITVIVISILLVVGFFVVVGSLGNPNNSGNNNSSQKGDSSVVSEVDGKQIIEVTVQGGYSPTVISAKSGIQTILRMKSNNTYGCERSFQIPSLGIAKNLPSKGDTDIQINSQGAGTKLKGTCSMGMYNFTINFI